MRRCKVRRLTFTPSQNLYSCTTIVLISATAVLFEELYTRTQVIARTRGRCISYYYSSTVFG
eukprot:COSAG01_NODE_9092_length_2559_cov_7.257724_4_plen_62_part_00